MRGTVSAVQGTHASLMACGRAGSQLSSLLEKCRTHHPALAPGPHPAASLQAGRSRSLPHCLSHAALGAALTCAGFRNHCLAQPGLRGLLLLMVKY